MSADKTTDRETSTMTGSVCDQLVSISRPLRGLWEETRRLVVMSPLGFASGLVLIALLGLAIFAPQLAPHDPNKMYIDARLLSPRRDFILGTDDLGRDVLSRLLYGSRISLSVGFVSALFGTTIGAAVGLFGGYLGGKIDDVIQRGVDMLMSFPTLLLALAVVAALGSSFSTLVLAISISAVPRAARVVRSSVVSIKYATYIDAAKVIGCTAARIIARHVLPNAMPAYLVMATAQLGNAILAEAAISFLGLGVPPPAATWGGMLSGSAALHFELAPWTALAPGMAIALAVLAFNLFGDALRDTWDPRLRRI